eukprot:gene3711-6600_t
MKIQILLFFLLIGFCFSRWSSRKIEKRVYPGSYFPSDFSTSAKQLRAKVDCSARCESYLLLATEYEKLKRGETFNTLKSGKDIYYDEVSLISQSVLLAVVNRDRSSPIDVVLELDEFLEDSNPIAGIFIGFGTAVCCTCCIGIVCVGIIIQSKRKGGYTAIGYDASSMNNGYNYQQQEYGASQTYSSVGEVTGNLYDNQKNNQNVTKSTYGSIDVIPNSQNEFSGTIGNENYYSNEQALDEPEEEKKIQKIFNKYDTNCNGVIEVREFDQVAKDVEDLMAKDMTYWNIGELAWNSKKPSKIQGLLYGNIGTIFQIYKNKGELFSANICNNKNDEISSEENLPSNCVIVTKNQRHSDFGKIFIFSADNNVPEEILKSLCLNKVQKIPIRLVRHESLDTEYSPRSDYRYDGLYWVTDFWKEKAKTKIIFKFRFVRLSGQESIPKRNLFETKDVKFDPKKIEKYLAYEEEVTPESNVKQEIPVKIVTKPMIQKEKKIEPKKKLKEQPKTQNKKIEIEKKTIKKKIVEKKIPEKKNETQMKKSMIIEKPKKMKKTISEKPKRIDPYFDENEVYSDEEDGDDFIDDSEINNNSALLSQMIQTIMRGNKKRVEYNSDEEDDEDDIDGPMTQADIDREEERLLKLAKKEDKLLLERDEKRRQERLNKKRKIL